MIRKVLKIFESSNGNCTSSVLILFLEMVELFHERMVHNKCICKVQHHFLAWLELLKKFLETNEVREYGRLSYCYIVLLVVFGYFVSRLEQASQGRAVEDMENKLSKNARSNPDKQVG